MMKETLNIADVLDYMADVWQKKMDADTRHDTRESAQMTHDFFTLEDMVTYCMGQDNDETREQISKRVQCRISEKIFNDQISD